MMSTAIVRPTVVFDLIAKSQHRRCDQIKVYDHRWAKPKDIEDAWGPPDYIAGSGFSYLTYLLEDGTKAFWSPNFVDFKDAKHAGMVAFHCGK